MNYQMCQEKLKNSSNYGDTYTIYDNYTGSQEIWKGLNTNDYIKILANVVIIAGGLLGNVSVILTVILNKSMRTTINFYVANLAVADAMICIFCMIPHAINVASASVYIFGTFMCKFNPFTQMTCLISSVLTLSAISFDRFLVVVFSSRMIGVKQRTSLVISLIWVASIAVSMPLLFFKKHIYIQWQNFTETQCSELWPVSWYYDETSAKCVPHTPLRVIYYFVICTTLYFLPVLIMIPAYSLIVWTVRTRPGAQLTHLGEQQNRSGEQHETNPHSRTSKRVNQMVLFVLIAFITCWTPFQAIVMFSAVHNGTPLPKWFRDIKWASYYLAYANSFINPIIYGGFNKTFRDGFFDILRCGFTRSRLGSLALSIRTLTTHFTSSLTRRSPKSRTINKVKKNSYMYNIELKMMHNVSNGDISSAAKVACIATAKTGDKGTL